MSSDALIPDNTIEQGTHLISCMEATATAIATALEVVRTRRQFHIADFALVCCAVLDGLLFLGSVNVSESLMLS
ncbi:hypothetical protein V6N11_034698 [Hibiscus sabdariffa]|uniref:Uncharacterized protein n=1 Tax=Hibiscus sabdariffa TaxID=183260 RepID=A0ABR2NDT2_9ROSI